MSRRYTSPVWEREVPPLAYDAAIVIGLLGSCGLALRVHPIFWLAAAVLFWGSFVEPRLLTVKRYAVGKGERALRIAFLSDIHVGPYKRAGWVRRLVWRTQALAPDLVLLGGDFLYIDAEPLDELTPLKDLKPPLGVFAVLGNHDERHARREAEAWFGNAGIPLLHNRSVRLTKDGAPFSVAGTDDDWYGDVDFSAAFGDLRPDEPAVVILHNPDLAPPAAERLRGRTAPTLFFSGHAHGGQIRLPLLGPVPRLPHHLGRKYDRGLFPLPAAPTSDEKTSGEKMSDDKGSGIVLVIGQGVGESGPRARLFCPPAIELVTLRF